MENEKNEVLERIKSILNTAGDMAKQGLDRASQKTGEAWDTTKLRWRVSELQCEIKQLFCELGRSAYAEHLTPGSSQVKPEVLYAELNKKHVDLEQLKRELNLRRGERPCPNSACTATSPASDTYCGKCGAPMNSNPEVP